MKQIIINAPNGFEFTGEKRVAEYLEWSYDEETEQAIYIDNELFREYCGYILKPIHSCPKPILDRLSLYKTISVKDVYGNYDIEKKIPEGYEVLFNSLPALLTLKYTHVIIPSSDPDSLPSHIPFISQIQHVRKVFPFKTEEWYDTRCFIGLKKWNS